MILKLYGFVYDQLPPPFAVRFQIRYTHPISLDCHQLYIAIIANAMLVCKNFKSFLRSTISSSLSNIVRFPPLR